MIEFAKVDDRAELREIFNESFPSEEHFSEMFFREYWDCNLTIVIRKNGEIQSMVQLLPQKIFTGAQTQNAYYLFALGTRKSARGQGLAANLMRQCEEVAHQNNIDLIFLIPQEKSLFEYYEKQGYENYFFVETKKTVGKNIPWDIKTVTATAENAAEMCAIYETALQGTPHVMRDKKIFEMLMRVYGAENVSLIVENGAAVAYAIFEKTGTEICVREAFGKNAEVLAQSACGTWQTVAPTRKQPLAMAIPVCKQLTKCENPPYCNLLFN